MSKNNPLSTIFGTGCQENFSQVPKGTIGALRGAGASLLGASILITLSSYWNQNDSTGIVHPTLNQLADGVGSKWQNIRREIKALEEDGWLTTVSGGRGLSNRYCLLPMGKKLTAFYEKQAKLDQITKDAEQELKPLTPNRNPEELLTSIESQLLALQAKF